MNEQYLTIKEFSKLANITPQAIYKELNKPNNRFKPFIKLVDNKKLLSSKALFEIYNITVEQPSNQYTNQVEQPIKPQESNNYTEIIELMNKELDMLKQQLESKDRELQDKQKTIDKLIDTNTLQSQNIAFLSKRVQEIEMKKDEERKPTFLDKLFGRS